MHCLMYIHVPIAVRKVFGGCNVSSFELQILHVHVKNNVINTMMALDPALRTGMHGLTVKDQHICK